MINNKVIIDGVDVCGCGFFHPEYNDTDCHIALAFADQYDGCIKCEQNPNCYYKQLQRKTQECEKLEKELKREENNINEFQKGILVITEGLNKRQIAFEEIEKIAITNCGYCANAKCPRMENILGFINKAKEQE